MTGPLYLGPVLNGPNPGAAGGNSKASSEKIFKDEAKTELKVAPPVGDDLGSGVKKEESQVPQSTSTQTQPTQTTSDSRKNENGHTVSDVNALPPMKNIEDAYIKGVNMGPIELIELEPPLSSQKGVFIAKKQSEIWKQMVNDAQTAGISLKLNSGFRSFEQQKYLFEGRQRDPAKFNVAAKPGFSNHQNGIAFDIAGTGGGYSAIYRWLANNAGRYGFYNAGRFFKSQKESWHWEFVGKEDQRVLAEEKISVDEKIKSLQKKS